MIIKIKSLVLNVALADTTEKHMQGLQGIKSLGDTEGMLFVYDEVQPSVDYHMRGVEIPLDIIFIDENCRITKIYHANPDENKITAQNVNYVLETKQNLMYYNKIKVGDTIDKTNLIVSNVLRGYRNGSEYHV